MMNADLNVSLVVGEAFILVSFWKPLIILATLAAWGWVVSSIYDKHAARFFLPREMWNLVHLIAGLVALAVAVLFPIKGEVGFWIGWAVMLVILFADLMAYAMVANKDDRVPEAFKIKADIFSKMAEKRAAKADAKQQAKSKLVLRAADKSALSVPTMESPEFAVRTAAEDIYLKAVASRASQVEIAPTGQGTQFQATMLVDGVPMKGDVMEGPLAVKVMDLWKQAAKLDVNDRRKKQLANVQVEQGETKRTARITSVGVQGGMKVSMLFDPEESVRRKGESLGLVSVPGGQDQMADLATLTKEVKGLVLLAAPADGGRTTLFYSVLGMHDAYTNTVQTVETDIQSQLEGVRHQQFDPTMEGADYATLVRSMLRRDPNVLGVAEMPDAATAKNISQADFSRCRVYVGLRADSAMAAADGWVKAVGDPAAASKHLRAVVAGRLIRKLCTNCRVPYPASAEMLKKLGVPESTKVPQLFKKGGQVLIKNKPEVCPVCSGIGYAGQEGIYEVYLFEHEERELLSQNNLPGVRASIKKRGLISIQQAAIRKAIEGHTSVEEVMRVTAPPASSAAPVPAKS